MKKSNWQPVRRIEVEYLASLKRLANLAFDYAREAESPEDFTARLERLAFEQWFQNHAYLAAEQMITGVMSFNARTWREAARKSMRGRMIYEALQQEMHGEVGNRVRALVLENAQLIKTFPGKVAEQVSNYALKRSQEGARASTIATELKDRYPHASSVRIHLIARTETSKASTSLTRARSEELDVKCYVWRSSEDQRVRISHRFMDKNGGIIIFWDDAPAPEALIGEKSTLGHYHAGDCPNCRCYPEPLLNLDQVRWPHRVYRNGSIQMMTRAQFQRLTGTPSRVAA